MKQMIKFEILLVVFMLMFLTAGCSKDPLTQNTDKSDSKTTTEVIVSVPKDIVTSTNGTENETDQEETNNTTTVDASLPINILTGLNMDETNLNRRPIAVMLDNQYDARPQAALENADIVYEFLAEGRITRYMAIFYSERPDHIGPVRSARPYFLVKALEFDPYYVHVGGSMAALADIRTYKMADIDGLNSGAFWREKHKKIPHNMYTSSEVLIKDASSKKYRSTSEFTFLKFYDQFTTLKGDMALNVKFVYKEPNQSDKVGYSTLYKYNNEEKVYYRYTNSEPHKDENSKVQLKCTNILVQFAKTKVLDREGRLSVELIGKGEGLYLTSGKSIPVTWKKNDAFSTTEFFTLDGQAVHLNLGKTFYQIMETASQVQITN